MRRDAMKWLGACAAAVLMAGAARIAAQPPQNPFLDHDDRGETVHVLPTPAAVHTPFDTQPTDRDPSNGLSVYPASYGSGNLTDHGGPEISLAQFRAIYWNASVANFTATSLGYATIKDQINGFINVFGGDSSYSQSSPTDDYSIIQQYGSRNAISASLPNLGFKVDTKAKASRISDSSIQSYLATLFNNGEPVSESTLYGVYFPSGMKISLQGGTSCSSFCGYHSHFTYNGKLIKYAVFPYTDCRACSVSGKSVADILTIVTSHEIREAVTDSLGTAWYDSQGYEADDKCAWHNLYQTSNGGFWVQPEFSNGGGIYPGPGCVVAK